MSNFVNITLKGHFDTGWISKTDEVKTISTQLDEVIAAVEELTDTPTETVGTREDAPLITNEIENF